LQFDAEAECLDDPAADLIFKRIVAEQRKMPGVIPGATGCMRPCAAPLLN
jgi:hypothetical protein